MEFPADKLGRNSGISGYLPGRVDEARWNQGTGKNNYVASDKTRSTFPEPLGKTLSDIAEDHSTCRCIEVTPRVMQAQELMENRFQPCSDGMRRL